MLVDINDNLIEEILHLDAEFDKNASDDCFETAADLIGVLAEDIRNQSDTTSAEQ